jgi:choline transport protein
MFFSLDDLDAITTTATGVPILELFAQTVSNKGAVIFLQVLVTLSGMGTLISSQTWQSRLAWSFSRDNGIVGSRYWSQIHPTLMVPLNAHILSVIISAILLCLYMASLTAFNSMVSACVVFLYLSYLVPTVNLLLRGRNSVPKGPFWLGTWGLIANWGTVAWAFFTTIFFSFPFVMPEDAGNMNYLSAVLGVYLIYILGYWFVRGHKKFAIAS